MSDDYPLISAMMLVGRVKPTDVMACIRCYKAQTYPNKELIIINNAKNQFAASELNIEAEPDIALIDTPVELSAGMARNYGISAANGQILAQFDPDFWYAPERLETQVSAMAREGAHICAFASCLSYSFVSGIARLWTNNAGAILNTMIFARPAQIDYPDFDHGEEREILRKMSAAGMRSISINRPELCCRLHLCADEVLEPIVTDLSDQQSEVVRMMLADR